MACMISHQRLYPHHVTVFAKVIFTVYVLLLINQAPDGQTPTNPSSPTPIQQENMAFAIPRTNAARTALRAGKQASSARAGLAGVTFTRGKATLPDLPCTMRSSTH